MIKIQNLEWGSSKTFLVQKIFAKGYTPNWSEKVLLLAKLKVQFHGHMLLMILMAKKLLENFMKKNCRRLIKKNSE